MLLHLRRNKQTRGSTCEVSTYPRIGAGRVGETESNSNAGSAFELQIEEDRGRVRSGRRERMLPPLVPSGQQLVYTQDLWLVGWLTAAVMSVLALISYTPKWGYLALFRGCGLVQRTEEGGLHEWTEFCQAVAAE